MDAPTYSPTYMGDEVITDPVVDSTGKTHFVDFGVNPQYCLSQGSADQLLAILCAAYPKYTIQPFLSDPERFDPASPAKFNLKVPWISITDLEGNTYNLNGGQFSAYWASASQAAAGESNDPVVAWRNAQQDVKEGLQGG